MTLWTADEIANVTGGKAQGAWSVDGISIDSREIKQGDLFVALKAARDGHEFVKMAIEKGASGALVSHVPEGCEHAPLVIVDNVEVALAQMGKARRAEVNAKVVAVTGSAGKTSTKEMLRHTFEAFGKTHASVKSFNNHWGVPLTLARMPRDTEFGIFEIGMNAPGEIEPLVKMVRPDVAVITNIAAVHLAGFENEEGIALEKSAIMSGLPHNGLTLVLGDMAHTEFVKSRAQTEVQTFGRKAENAIRLESEHNTSEGGSGTVIIGAVTCAFQVPVAGAHHLQNALIVFGVAKRFGIDLQDVAAQLATWQAPPGRGEKIKLGDMIIVDESYNANPLSMRAAITSFATLPAKRKVAFLGAMKELGPETASLHAELADIPELAQIDVVHCIGDEMRALYERLQDNRGQFFVNADEILINKDALLEPDDAIMLKSSLTVGLGKIVDALKNMRKSSN